MKTIKLLTCFLLCCSFLYAQDNFYSVFKRINSEVQQNSQAYQNLKQSTEYIGHRLTGSTNGAKAEEMAYRLLKSYGVQVRYQPFEVESWDRRTLTFKMGVNPSDLSAMKAVTLAHSPVVAHAAAELIDVGNGLEEDYQPLKDKIKGKIVLIYLGLLPGSPKGTAYLHRSEKTAIAIKYGAVGVVIINTVRGGVLLTGTASVTGKLISIPAVCIGLEDGMELKEKLRKANQYAQIDMTNFSGMIKARNIIATFRGKILPQEKIVVGAHLDSWDLATGAIDNGLGSFSVIDMVRTFARLKLQNKRTIEFVLFMGEEQGLLGSKAYIEQSKYQKNISQIRYMLNYDMTNDPKGFSTTRKEMESLVKSWGNQMFKIDSAYKNIFQSGAGLHSDHQPFMLEGISVGTGTGGKLPNNSGQYYHSDGDNFQLVDKQGMKNNVRFGSMMIYALANTDTIPVKRFTDEELKIYLEQQNLKQPLSIAGEWRWKD